MSKAEPEEPSASPEAEAKAEPEASAPEAESEASAPEAEASAPEPEADASAPEADAPAPESEADASAVEASTPDSEAETPEPEPATPDSESGSEAQASTPEPEAPTPAKRRWGRIAAGVVGGAVLLVVLGPTLLSQGLLGMALRSAFAGVGPGSGVAEARIAWTRGVSLSGLQLEQAGTSQQTGFAVWAKTLEVKTWLLPAAAAASGGGELSLQVVLHEGGFRLDLASEEAAEPPPAEEPPAAESNEAPLPMSLDLGLDLQGLSLHLRSKGPLLLGEGLSASGRLKLARDLSATLAEPLKITASELSIPLGAAETPWSDAAVLRDVTLDVREFAFPAGGGLGDLKLEAALSCGELEFSGIRFADLLLSVSVADGKAHLELRGKHPGADGEIVLATDVDGSNDTAWPVELDLDLKRLPVKGLVGDYAAFLLPLVHETRGRRGDFPPVSLQAKGKLRLVFGEDGPDPQAILDSLDTRGSVGLGQGELHASRVLRAYTAGLTRLEIADLLEGVVPQRLAFDGGSSDFTITGGRLRLHALDLDADRLRLRAEANVGLADQSYEVVLHATPRGEVPEVARAVLRTIERAGGVKVRGKLDDSPPEAVLPGRDVLLKAIDAEGTAKAWLERGGPTLEGAGDALRGLIPGR